MNFCNLPECNRHGQEKYKSLGHQYSRYAGVEDVCVSGVGGWGGGGPRGRMEGCGSRKINGRSH